MIEKKRKKLYPKKEGEANSLKNKSKIKNFANYKIIDYYIKWHSYNLYYNTSMKW